MKWIILAGLLLLIIALIELEDVKKTKNLPVVVTDDNKQITVTELESNPMMLADSSPESIKLLADITKTIKNFEKALWDRFSSGDIELLPLATYLNHLHERMDKVEISEGFLEKRTSYSIDKQYIILCMRSKEKDTWGQLQDINTIVYALLHELSHVACPCLDHPPEFSNIFRNILYQAIRYNIWKPVNYHKTPMRYCGDDITTTPITLEDMEYAVSRPLILPIC
jgi:hypothetical protein